MVYVLLLFRNLYSVSKVKIIIKTMVKGFKEAANHDSIFVDIKAITRTGNAKADFLMAIPKLYSQPKRKVTKPTKPVSIMIVIYELCVLPW
jgi:hypothetical protein